MLVQSLGQEGPLEEGMTTHSSILAWRVPWTEEPGGLRFRGSDTTEELDTTEVTVCTRAHSYFTLLSISAVQRSESAVCIHTSPLFWISFAFRSPQSTE